jgi:hypothetical protein
MTARLSKSNRRGKVIQPTSFRAFWIWCAATSLLILIATVVGVGWAVRHALGDGPLLPPIAKRVLVAAAEFPVLVRTAFREAGYVVSGDPYPMLLKKNNAETKHWIRRFPAPEDPGFLLLSGVDPTLKQAGVTLIRIQDGAVMARWRPDWPAIFERIHLKNMHSMITYEPLKQCTRCYL